MKKSIFLTSIALCSIFALSAGQSFAEEKSGIQKGYEITLAAAKDAQKKAQAVGGEWRDTGAILKKAEAAAEKGDFETAQKLAATAKFQGEMGQIQAASQANVGNPDYLY